MGKKHVDRSRKRGVIPTTAKGNASTQRAFSVQANDNFFRDVEHAIDARLVQQRLVDLSVDPQLAEAMSSLRYTICTQGRRSVAANAENLTVLFKAIPELFDPFPQAERTLLRARLGFADKLPSKPEKLAKYFKVSSDDIAVTECNSLTAVLQLLPPTEQLTSVLHSRYAPETTNTTASGRTMPARDQAKKHATTKPAKDASSDLSELKVPRNFRRRHAQSDVDISAETLAREVAEYLEWYRRRVAAIVDSPMLVSEQEQLIKILARVPSELSQYLIEEFHHPAADGSPRRRRRQPRIVGVHEAVLEKDCARTTLHRYVNNGECGFKLGENNYFFGSELETLIVKRGRPRKD